MEKITNFLSTFAFNVEQFATFLSNFIWNNIVIYVLLIFGIYFSLKLRFVQIRKIKDSFKLVFEKPNSNSKNTNKNAISAFAALSVGSSTRVGAGNLAGVAIAIVLGGSGAIFWMWIFAILGASSSFIENTLAQAYKKKTKKANTYIGGPAYYMQQGLKNKFLGSMFCIFIIIGYGLVFNSVQANTISYAFSYFLGIDRVIVGLALVSLVAFSVFGGLRRISLVTKILFPVMVFLYVFIVLYIVIVNIDRLPSVIASIFGDAFGIKQTLGGGIGYAMIQGARVGLFANEAGMGTSPIAAAAAEVSHPVKQGLVQVLGVFIDTFIVCTSTAFLILITDVIRPGMTENGIEITQLAMKSVFGNLGSGFVAIVLLLFSFTSIIGNYYYSQVGVEFFSKKPIYITFVRLSIISIVLLGAITSLETVWSFGNFFIGLMVVTNIFTLAFLLNIANNLRKDYYAQIKEGKTPIFKKDGFKGLEDVECW